MQKIFSFGNGFFIFVAIQIYSLISDCHRVLLVPKPDLGSDLLAGDTDRCRRDEEWLRRLLDDELDGDVARRLCDDLEGDAARRLRDD